MTKKEIFINEIKAIMVEPPESVLSPDALDFWNGLNATGDTEKPAFTENGKLVLKYMQDNKEIYNNLFKAKDVGEGLSISSRTVSGALRKLVNDQFVEKVGTNPTIYSLTQKGIEANPDAE